MPRGVPREEMFITSKLSQQGMASYEAALQEADAGVRLKELRVDGGASANNLLMQFQSDLLNVPIIRPRVTETTAIGAAYLAGLAVGYWKSKADIAQQWQQDRRFEPKIKSTSRRMLVAGWDKALARAKNWCT